MVYSSTAALPTRGYHIVSLSLQETAADFGSSVRTPKVLTVPLQYLDNVSPKLGSQSGPCSGVSSYLHLPVFVLYCNVFETQIVSETEPWQSIPRTGTCEGVPIFSVYLDSLSESPARGENNFLAGFLHDNVRGYMTYTHMYALYDE